LITVGGKKSSLFHVQATLYSMDNDALSLGIKQAGMKMTHYLHLMLTLRMSGGIPPLSHMPSWHKTEDFTFTLPSL